MIEDNLLSKTKIIFMVTAMEAGGLENYLLNILRVIDRTRYEIILISTGRKSDFYKDELEALGVQTLFCRNSYRQFGYIVRIYRLLQKLRPDAVCDFRNDFAAPTLLAANLSGVKSRAAMYRSTRKGFSPSFFKNMYAQIMHTCTKFVATKIIGNTTAVLNACFPEGHSGNQYAVVYNGVDTELFKPCDTKIAIRQEIGIPTDAIVIGHVGRLHPAKNHKIVLATFAKLTSDNANTHLLLVGDGVLRNQIENDINTRDLSDKVTFTGIRKDVHRMFGAMDIFFYPSIYEGLPNALLEAMASGLPFVASNINEIREIIPDALVGQLCDPNDKAGFLMRLQRLCNEKEYRLTLGQEARKWTMAKFELEVSVKALLQELVCKNIETVE